MTVVTPALAWPGVWTVGTALAGTGAVGAESLFSAGVRKFSDPQAVSVARQSKAAVRILFPCAIRRMLGREPDSVKAKQA